MRDDLSRVGRRFVSDLQRDDIAGLSAELAYRFLFAIFPFAIFAAALTAFVATAVGLGDPTDRIIGALGDNLPRDIADAIRPQLEAVIGTDRPGLLTFGAVAALWAATGGTNALIKAMNRAYEVSETRPLVGRYLLAVGLTLLASLAMIAAFVSIVGVSLVTDQLVSALGIDPGIVGAVGILRWPAIFLLVAGAVGVLFRVAPNVKPPWRWCLGGGTLFAVGWIVVTALFGLYVANFANYSNTYGALGGVIVLMLEFYLSALILVAAAAVVASGLKELAPDTIGFEPGAAASTSSASSDSPGEAGSGDSPGETLAPGDSSAAVSGATAAGASSGATPVAPSAAGGPARRQSVPRRPRPPLESLSGLETWAVAAAIISAGAAVGVAASWVLGRRRS